MEFPEKLEKLLLHWIEHNSEHAKSYLKWAEEARSSKLERIAELLESAHQDTLKINDIFEEARKILKEEVDS